MDQPEYRAAKIPLVPSHETSQRIREVIEAAREWTRLKRERCDLADYLTAGRVLAAAVDRLDSPENKTT